MIESSKPVDKFFLSWYISFDRCDCKSYIWSQPENFFPYVEKCTKNSKRNWIKNTKSHLHIADQMLYGDRYYSETDFEKILIIFKFNISVQTSEKSSEILLDVPIPTVC